MAEHNPVNYPNKKYKSSKKLFSGQVECKIGANNKFSKDSEANQIWGE